MCIPRNAFVSLSLWCQWGEPCIDDARAQANQFVVRWECRWSSENICVTAIKVAHWTRNRSWLIVDFYLTDSEWNDGLVRAMMLSTDRKEILSFNTVRLSLHNVYQLTRYLLLPLASSLSQYSSCRGFLSLLNQQLNEIGEKTEINQLTSRDRDRHKYREEKRTARVSADTFEC